MPFPEINAGLNALATVFLTTGFILFRKGKRHHHRIALTSAFVISVLFLISKAPGWAALGRIYQE